MSFPLGKMKFMQIFIVFALIYGYFIHMADNVKEEGKDFHREHRGLTV